MSPTTPIESIQWDNSVEDRPLPALTNIKDNYDYIIPTLPMNDSNEEHPENLSDLARTAFDLSIQYFGEYDVACLLSKKFPLRESALSNVTKRVDVDLDGKDVEGIDKVGLIKATFQIIKEALEDNPEKLTLQALTLWETITNFTVHHQIPTSSTWKLVDKTYPLLFGKISDSNSRIKQNAINLFILLAKTYNTSVHSAVSLVLKPAKSNSQPPKQSKAKVELVTRLVEEFGIDKVLKLNLESVMQVSVSYLNNNNGEVRDSAVKLVVEVIKLVGREKVKDFIIDIKPILSENIWNLVNEYEETTGKIAGQIPSPPPSPKIKPDIKDLEVNEELIRTPLAQRGTVTRLEQQVMELKSMFNTTNSFLKDDYSTVIAANAAKVIEEPEELTEQELKELEELEAEELLLKNSNNVPDSCVLPSKVEKTSKKSSTRIGSKPTPTPGKQNSKKSKTDTVPPKKQPLKGSLTSKPVLKDRRDSAEEIKRISRKGSKPTDTTLCEEPDECEASKENLVTHYWTECPVLTKCRLCNIILEISTLDDHMLTDCDKAKFVKQCPTCREVVDADDYLAHVNKQTCLAIRDDIVRCPLCKTVIKPATEEGWKSHLLNTNGCPKNRRKSNVRPNTSTAESSTSGGKKHASKKTTEIGSKSSLVSKTLSKSKVTTSNGACPICKSRKWHSDGLGGLVCQFGHQREGFQEQENEIEPTPVTGKRRRSRTGKATNEHYAYQNRTEYTRVLLSVIQWVLRRQLHVLIHEMGFVPQIEQVVQHLWILYVNKISEMDLDPTSTNHDVSEGYSSTFQDDNEDSLEFLIDVPQDSDSDSENDDQQRSGANEFYDFKSTAKTFANHHALPCRISSMRLSYVLAIIYLGCVWLRIPIINGDIIRWASTGRLSYLIIRQELPNDMKLHLGSHFVKKFFEKERIQSYNHLINLETDFIAFYKNFYGITFPEINAPPILYRFIRDFMLPVESYVISKELAQLINLKLELNRNLEPYIALLAVIIVVIKMIYGLDGRTRVPSDKDELFQYFPKFEDWIKKLSERQEKNFSKEIPSDFSDLKEWIDSNPDKYIKYCSDTLIGRERWPQKSENTHSYIHRYREKKIEEMERLSKPFHELSEMVVPVIEDQVRENKLKILEKATYPTLQTFTIQGFYMMQKEKKRNEKIIENFKNGIDDFIEPIEEEIQELNFCVEVPDKQKSSKIHSFSEDPLKDLRNRYSTFLFRKYRDNDGPNLTFGEEYTAYLQNRSESTLFKKSVELVGDFHEDYERILVFASKMVNTTMYVVQEAVMKIEVDLYRIIESENL
ncbi:8528_t:CDS:10 [Scutellospora calospora]|uniref:8528_t:CDS:1 n=1 Tax=Scutellospora calospora TaxID=85575 RepID=A0ACA9KYP2_9GLOM|nr:8528_t:CDS:10 [Scutellospora calospora]